MIRGNGFTSSYIYYFTWHHFVDLALLLCWVYCPVAGSDRGATTLAANCGGDRNGRFPHQYPRWLANGRYSHPHPAAYRHRWAAHRHLAANARAVRHPLAHQHTHSHFDSDTDRDGNHDPNVYPNGNANRHRHGNTDIGSHHSSDSNGNDCTHGHGNSDGDGHGHFDARANGNYRSDGNACVGRSDGNHYTLTGWLIIGLEWEAESPSSTPQSLVWIHSTS